MEDVNFFWILHALSQTTCIIPLLDTIILKDNKVITSYIAKGNNIIRDNPIEPIGVNTFIVNLINQHSLRNKLRRSGDVICYSISKLLRTSLTLKDLKDYCSGNLLILQKTHYLQLAKPQCFLEQKVLVLKLVYCSGKYTSSLYIKKNKQVLPFLSNDYYEKAKDIGRLLMLYLEEVKNKTVLIIGIEFISDDDYKL